MAWFLSQSFIIIVTTFVLGLLVGWLWWGRQWRKVAFTESAAVQTVARRLESVVTERDAEIARLQVLVDPAETAPRYGADASPGSAEPAPEARTEPPAGAATAPAAPAAPADVPGTTDPTGAPDPAETAAARPEAEPDNLERIEGIGPRIATALQTAGITTYHALALADEEQLRGALREAGLVFAPSLVTWSRQAALLAGGDEAAFHALTSQLVRGPHRAPDPHPDPESGPRDEAEPEAGSGADPEDEDGPEDEDEEDLERVEGIGPRIATALRKAGIRTYRQLADSDVPTLQAALDASGLRFAPSLPTWPRQAALLADGDEDGFVALTNTLVAGRDSGRKA